MTAHLILSDFPTIEVNLLKEICFKLIAAGKFYE